MHIVLRSFRKANLIFGFSSQSSRGKKGYPRATIFFRDLALKQIILKPRKNLNLNLNLVLNRFYILTSKDGLETISAAQF
jgi:hypothetical protein